LSDEIKKLSDEIKKLAIIPLGGLGEFGMNCLAVRWEDDIIVIDGGLMFPRVGTGWASTLSCPTSPT